MGTCLYTGEFCLKIYTFLFPPVDFALLTPLLIFNPQLIACCCCSRKSWRPLRTSPPALFTIAEPRQRGCQIYHRSQEEFILTGKNANVFKFKSQVFSYFKTHWVRSNVNEFSRLVNYSWRRPHASYYAFIHVCTHPRKERWGMYVTTASTVITLNPWLGHRKLLWVAYLT